MKFKRIYGNYYSENHMFMVERDDYFGWNLYTKSCDDSHIFDTHIIHCDTLRECKEIAQRYQDEADQKIDWDAVSDRVHAAVSDTFRALEKAGVISDLEITDIPARKEPTKKEQKTMKIYLNHSTTERGTSATEAMSWHRAGDLIQVLTYDENGKELSDIMIDGAAPAYELDENTRHCKAIAQDVDAYASGEIRRCPDCGEEIRRDDWNYIGDKFRCPECGAVGDPEWWDILSIWDYLSDVYNIEFRTNGKSADDLRSVQIMVACGGPNIYLDTASRDVELYWWSERARWPLSSDAVEAIDEWAADYWGCL